MATYVINLWLEINIFIAIKSWFIDADTAAVV
jgi:hypothetical protein